MVSQFLSDTTNNGFTINSFQYHMLDNNVQECVKICHDAAKAGGWWNDLETGQPKQRNVGEMLCLIHSEISEAMEGHRKSKMDEHLPHLPSVAVELADALIRIFDVAGGLKIDLALAFAQKLHYNQSRQDHKVEIRMMDEGKKY